MFAKKFKLTALIMTVLFLVPAMAFPVSAAEVVTTEQTLKTAVGSGKDGTTIEIGDNFEIGVIEIKSSVTIDGKEHTLTANQAEVGATIAPAEPDGKTSTFKDITLDGGNLQKKDTCLWVGRCSWIWENVTVTNWDTKKPSDRGAISVANSSKHNDPGKLTIRNSTITNNQCSGLTLAQDKTTCTVYSATITGNAEAKRATDADVRIDANGTLTFADEEGAEGPTEKTIGSLQMKAGTLNLSGNTSIQKLDLNGGSVHITGNITSEEGITLGLEAGEYAAGKEIATVNEDVDADKAAAAFHVPEEGAGYKVAADGQKLVLKECYTVTIQDDTNEGSTTTLSVEKGKMVACHSDQEVAWTIDNEVLAIGKKFTYIPTGDVTIIAKEPDQGMKAQGIVTEKGGAVADNTFTVTFGTEVSEDVTFTFITDIKEDGQRETAEVTVPVGEFTGQTVEYTITGAGDRNIKYVIARKGKEE